MANQEGSRWLQFLDFLRENRALMPLKAVMFLYYGAVTMFMPYITLHMIQVGITIEEVAVIYFVLPFASCLGPPIAGMIADKIGNYKIVLMTTIIMTATFHSLLCTIDAHGYPPRVDDNITTQDYVYINCDESGETLLEWTSCSNGTCPSATFQADPIIKFVSSDCYQYCGGKSGEVCHYGDVGCTPLKEGLGLELNLVASNVKKIPKQPNRCLMGVDKILLANTSTSVELTCKCSIQCPAILDNMELRCSIPKFDHHKHNKGFWLYLICRILATMSLGTSFTMLDASSICLIKKHKGELGKQRICGVIGSSVFGMASGILIDWVSSSPVDRDYSITFYFADCLFVLVLVFLSLVEVEVEKTEGSFIKDVMKLIRLVHIDIFMLMMLLLGTCWGFLEAFLFIFLTELKATSFLLGITVALGSVVGIPFLYISDTIVRKIGRIVLLLSGFFVYALRFIGYSYITNPWLSLPFEALEAVTVHLMGVSMSLFCASAAPPGLLATLQGFAGAVHYSIGRGVGSFGGGYFIATFGTRNTFRIFGIGAATSGVIFIVLNHFFMRTFEKATAMRRPTIVEPRVPVVFSPLNRTELDFDEHPVDPYSSRKNSFLEVPSELNALSRRLSF